MTNDALQPLFVPACANSVNDFNLKRAPAPRCNGFYASHNFTQVNPNGCSRRRGSFTKLQHQLTHAVQRVLYRQQHVLLKLGVLAVALGVLHHQRQLRHDVFQVVHDEGRHPVERVELAHLQQRLGGLHLR